MSESMWGQVDLKKLGCQAHTAPGPESWAAGEDGVAGGELPSCGIEEWPEQFGREGPPALQGIASSGLAV